MRARAALALAVGALLLAAPPAEAVSQPLISESWVEKVKADSALLWARINPNGLLSTYRFEVVSQADFEASGYSTAMVLPPMGKGPLGSGASPVFVNQAVGAPLNTLTPTTTYRYRVTATNQEGTTPPVEHFFTTQASEPRFGLPDDRGWEMVSPKEKNGGEIAAPEAVFGGGDFQAAPSSAPNSASITYGSTTAFGGAKGAPPESQYLSTRTANGWTTQNVSAALDSSAYGDEPDGSPYRVFSPDLGRGLLFGGLPCRGGLPGCPAPTPVLPGSGAPVGYMAYYQRDSGGGYTSLLTAGDLAYTAVSAEAFSVSLAASSPDLSHVVLSSCAKLTENAIEVPNGPGECVAGEQNLYEWSGGGLSLVNLLPGDTTGTPGALIAAGLGAVSADGSRVYFSETEDGALYLHEAGKATKLVPETVGGGASFQTASSDGHVAYFTKGGDLYRYDAQANTSTPIATAVTGVLGASADGSYVYYQDAAGLKLWHSGAVTTVATGANAATASDYLTSSSRSRVTPDGLHLAFLSTQELTGYDNGGRTEAYLFGPVGGGAPQLVCASCNPSGERAGGEASIPGALVNGSTKAYRPRALSDDGRRLFFDSNDELVVGDTNEEPDVYEWEARGQGGCVISPGCVSLISSGRATEGASFIDASADGTDAYFLTDESLVGEDPGFADVYDARVGGGFPGLPRPEPCIGDACQPLPTAPDDPDPGSLVKNPGNPTLKYEAEKQNKHHKRKSRHKHHHSKGGSKAHSKKAAR